jgi:hypothetical protein
VAAAGRVHISLDAIGALPAERIGCRFGEQTVRASGTADVPMCMRLSVYPPPNTVVHRLSMAVYRVLYR